MEHKKLEILNLSIGYETPIVKNINCNLYKSDFVVIFGSNGAGKSTLIKTTTQKNDALNGKIKLDGKLYKDYSKTELSKKIAIVSTNNQFDLNLTVYDILALGRVPYLNLFGKLRDKDIQFIEKYIDLLELRNLLQKYFYQLSDGQKQKVLIARALIQDTPIIILDEPTAHLDIKNRVFIFKLLQKIAKQENKSIICATHEIDIALKYSSKIWLIDKKQKFSEENPRETSTEKIYAKLF